jgi:prephenate dehydrogenase
MMVRRLRLGIIGLGQIGGSIAAALKRHNAPYHLFGHDTQPDLMGLAKRRRLIEFACDSDVDLIKNVDIIVAALPMFDIHRLLRERRRLLEGKDLVMDTGSTKKDVSRTAERLEMKNFVGGHPYAGTEKSGPAAWDPSLFQDQVFFLVPSGRRSSRAYREALRLVGSIGANPLQVDPGEHDCMFAFASGLPHIIAYSLIASQSTGRRRKKIDARFLAHSFSSCTRVAKSAPETTAQFLWQNRKHLTREIEMLKSELETFSSQLSIGDMETFVKHIVALRRLKENLE